MKNMEGKFTEGYEVNNLREFNLNDEFVMKFYRFFKKDLIHRDSISHVLHLVKFSQNTLARRNFYLTLCYMSILTKVSERGFRYGAYQSEEYSVLYTVQDPSIFFRGMEYHLSGTNVWDLYPSMWYDKSTFNSLFLPYDRYALKVTAAIFYTLGHYIEGIRRMKYNEYVKSHYFSCRKKRIRRVFYIKMSFKGRGYLLRLLKGRYFNYLKAQKYRIFRHEFYHETHYNYYNDMNSYRLIAQNKDLHYFRRIQDLPWKSYGTPFIYDLLILKFSFYANYLVSHYTDYYTLYSRLDYSFVSIILGYFMWKNYYISFFYRMVSNLILKDGCGEIVCSNDNIRYTLIIDLFHSQALIEDHYRYKLDTIVTKLDISNFSDVDYLQLLLEMYRFDMNDHLSRPNYYFGGAPESCLAFLPTFSGHYEEVDFTLTRTVFWSNYGMGRDFNKLSEEEVLDEAKLNMEELFKHLTLEYHYYSDQLSIWAMFLLVLRKNHILMGSEDVESFHKKQQDPRFDYTKNDYDGGKQEWKRPLLHPMLKIMNQVYCDVMKDVYMQLYSLSNPLDILTHFFIGNDEQVFDYFNTHQEKLGINLPVVVFTVERFYYVYTKKLNDYRRYPKRREVMSRNNPIYRQVGDVYYQKMRRTGIKVDVDLPYYSKSDEIDHIKELHMKRKQVGFEQGHKKRWIVI